jgi:methylenetetrahydrofolate dehydrogenase (NADP+)/methenyltetrahydrofolate cyclohydrolase
MSAIVLDGKTLARQMEVALTVRVQAITQKSHGISPILATILVGDDPSSATYVKMKGNACQRVGMESLKVVLPQTTTTSDLLTEIDKLNANPRVQGILLQHPVPSHIDKCAAYTPVPGGVGPMTIATLIAQTVDAAERGLSHAL